MTGHTRRDEIRAAVLAMLTANRIGDAEDHGRLTPELRGDLIDRMATLRMRLGIARGVPLRDIDPARGTSRVEPDRDAPLTAVEAGLLRAATTGLSCTIVDVMLGADHENLNPGCRGGSAPGDRAWQATPLGLDLLDLHTTPDPYDRGVTTTETTAARVTWARLAALAARLPAPVRARMAGVLDEQHALNAAADRAGQAAGDANHDDDAGYRAACTAAQHAFDARFLHINDVAAAARAGIDELAPHDGQLDLFDLIGGAA